MAGADVLYLGSSDGVVRVGDPVQGNFTFLALCGGPIHSLALDGQDVFIGDQSGSIYHFDAASNFVDYSFDSSNDATALLFEGGDLLVGGSDATVLRVDKDDGTVLATLDVQVPVGAMAMIDGLLYVGSPVGIIFRGDPVTGGFSFWGTCGGPIHSMTYDSTHVILGTNNGGSGGTVYRVNRQTQLVDDFFSVPNDGAGMVKHGGDLLMGGTDTTVHRLHRANGFVKGTFQNFFSVDAVALLEETEPGTGYCHGIAGACPCGNMDGEAGCANSDGVGALVEGQGTASVSADDLVLNVTNLAPDSFARFYMGAGNPQLPFGDGLLCAGPGGYSVLRFPVFVSGPNGSGNLSGIVAHAQANFPAQGQIFAGNTWNFQVWYRDPTGPCGGTVNTSNAYSVTFLP